MQTPQVPRYCFVKALNVSFIWMVLSRLTECHWTLNQSVVCMAVRRSCLLFALLYLLKATLIEARKPNRWKPAKRNPPCCTCLCSIYALLERRRSSRFCAVPSWSLFWEAFVPKMGSFRTKSRLLVFPYLKSKVVKARLFLLDLDQHLFTVIIGFVMI